MLQGGARVAAVSSSYHNRPNDSGFGANNALDADPSTEWSSNGDGDAAWIEIELAALTRVTKIGYWTRTMGSSAQVFSFRVLIEKTGTYGPFDLGAAADLYYFGTEFIGKRLPIEAVNTSGGKAGAIEIDVYGEAVFRQVLLSLTLDIGWLVRSYCFVQLSICATRNVIGAVPNKQAEGESQTVHKSGHSQNCSIALHYST